MQQIKKNKRIIGVIGTSKCEYNSELYQIAEEVGKEIGKSGNILICGGLGGVMEAAARGAKSVNGLTIGILPGSTPLEANAYIDIPIVTGMGEARNIIIVRSSEVIIAIGGGFGTLSELAFALKLNVPVIGLKTWNLEDKIIIAKDPKHAVETALKIIPAL